MVYHLDEPTFRQEFLMDAMSCFVRKNISYLTHILMDINELISDITSVLHLSLNMPDSNVLVASDLTNRDSSLSPRRRTSAR